jgi:hypothetical protein
VGESSHGQPQQLKEPKDYPRVTLNSTKPGKAQNETEPYFLFSPFNDLPPASK